MDAHDRYILALAMLEGDRDARKILADLLEEQGERGLAQWARQGHRSTYRQIEFAIMLLPCVGALTFGTELVDYSTSQSTARSFVEPEVTQIRKWLAGECSRQEMEAILRGSLSQPTVEPEGQAQHAADQLMIGMLSRFQDTLESTIQRFAPSVNLGSSPGFAVQPRPSGQHNNEEFARGLLSELREGVAFTAQSIAQSQADPSKGLRLESEAKLRVRRIASAALSRTRGVGIRGYFGPQGVLQWQCLRIKAILQKLTTQEDPFRWPR